MSRLSLPLFVVSVAVLAVVYGVVAAPRGWFPQPQIASAEATIRDLSQYWRNDFGLAPTRHLVEADDPERPAFRLVRPELSGPGPVLIAGLSPGRETLQGATLYDEEGQEIHHWAIDYRELDPDGLQEKNVLVHGTAAFPDGSIAVTFDAGNVIARIDACGDPMWVTDGEYHHVVSRSDDGTLWSWKKEILVQLDENTGEVLREIDLLKDIVEPNDLHGVFSLHSVENDPGIKYGLDAFHANDVDALPAAYADAFPQFDAGDLVISLRSLNLVAVVDPDTADLKWWTIGPWFRQHDPDFEPDGRISVYDNRMGLGASRITLVDPVTGETEELLDENDEAAFYSWRRGKHQVLPSGNVVVAESEKGRVFEASASGELVWERNMIFDEDYNYIITSAERLPPNFFDPARFTPGAASCGG